MVFSGLFEMTPRRSRDLQGVPRLHKRPGEEPANQASFYVYSGRQYVYNLCRHKLLISLTGQNSGAPRRPRAGM